MRDRLTCFMAICSWVPAELLTYVRLTSSSRHDHIAMIQISHAMSLGLPGSARDTASKESSRFRHTVFVILSESEGSLSVISGFKPESISNAT